MSTSKDDEADQLRYAEYVLGVLDADERAAVAHEVETDAAAATAVAAWQARLNPLAEGIAPLEPPPQVWERIERSLPQSAAPSSRAPVAARAGLWENLPLWHWLGIGASVVAASLLVLMLRAPSTSEGGYLTSTIRQQDGTTRWTAMIDLRHARLIVVPTAPVVLAQGRAPELWLIPPGQKPVPIGMVDRSEPVTIALDQAMVARLGPAAAFAVSVEPIGGSPTGQPTGPVIAQGSIAGVKAARG